MKKTDLAIASINNSNQAPVLFLICCLLRSFAKTLVRKGNRERKYNNKGGR
jgi:hypothetical protein